MSPLLFILKLLDRVPAILGAVGRRPKVAEVEPTPPSDDAALHYLRGANAEKHRQQMTGDIHEKLKQALADEPVVPEEPNER